jgi:hypothetical protein
MAMLNNQRVMIMKTKVSLMVLFMHQLAMMSLAYYMSYPTGWKPWWAAYRFRCFGALSHYNRTALY